MICSNSSDPPYSTTAPVAFSKIEITSLNDSSSGANQGPKIVKLSPDRSGPEYVVPCEPALAKFEDNNDNVKIPTTVFKSFI